MLAISKNATEIARRFSWVFILSNGVFLLLIAMSVYFYEERIYGSDPSSYLFGVTNNEWFYTERGRIVIWLSQWLPLIAVWLGFSMKTILIAHSIGHVLFFYFIFILGHFVFRNNSSGPVVIGIQLLGVALTYFAWPYGEVQYGLALVLVMMWVMQSGPTKGLYRFVISVLLCAFLIGSHPLVWVVAAFSVVCALLDKKQRKRALEYVIVGAALMLGKTLAFPSYDGELAGGALELFLNQNYTLNEFISMVWNKPLLFTGLVGSWLLLLFSGLFWQLALSVFSCLVITVVIGLYFPLNGATDQYYISFSGIALMTVVVYANSPTGLKKPKGLTLVNVFVLVVSLLCLPEILNTGYLHRQRTTGIKALISNCYENGIQVGIVKGSNFLKRAPGWSDPDLFHEVILLSSQEKTLRIQMFEHVMHHLVGVEGLGPNAPRSKKLNYPFTEKNQNFVRNHVFYQQPKVLNNRLFDITTNVGSIGFLNTASDNTRGELEACYIEKPYAKIKHGQLLVGFRLVNKNDSPIYSAQPGNVSVQLVTCDNEILLGENIELMTDVNTSIDEVIDIPVDINTSCITIRLMHLGQVVHEVECPTMVNG